MPDLSRFRDLIEQFKIPLGLLLVGIVLLTGGLISSSPQTQPQYPKESIVSSAGIWVDVAGAVKNPGVYNLSQQSRVEDAVEAAGGFLEEANRDFVAKNLNLAQKLTDGGKVYIPFEGESIAGAQVAGAKNQVNVNTASQSELESLSGIGPVTASKVIAGRPYQSSEELLERKIIGKATFDKIKDYITY